jgi:hypothetical protein
MTVITHNRRKSRLSQLIDTVGGVSVGVALAQARANLEALRPQGLAEIEVRIAELAELRADSSDQGGQPALHTVYLTANAIIDTAGPFDLKDICAAAAGLCDLIDAASPERPFDWRVVPVHARSMQLLMTLPDDAREARATVRQSLEQLVDRKLAQTSPD